jgi:acetyl-CoA synthetase
MSDDLDVLLTEHRKFDPPAGFRAGAAVSSPAVYEPAAADMPRYWAEQADKLEWIARYETVLDWAPPHATWFRGGKLNVSANCLDRHVRTGRRNKAALVFEGEPGDRRTLTYWDLYVQVNQFATC